jgi:four helix bundle protein
MNYHEWEQSVPAEIKGDTVWKAQAYRLALFAADLAWPDATKLLSDKRTISLADQLYRAVGGISADVEEGYSRGTGKDRARFYEYGLGSAREARCWYFKGRHVLGEQVANHRVRLLTHIIKLLLTMIPQQRSQALREEPHPYGRNFEPSTIGGSGQRETLFECIPMPEL